MTNPFIIVAGDANSEKVFIENKLKHYSLFQHKFQNRGKKLIINMNNNKSNSSEINY